MSRARAKLLSTSLGAALAELRRARGEAAAATGEEDWESWRMAKAYRNTVYCACVVEQSGGTLRSRYCSNRWCLVCGRVRTGRAINRYLPVLSTWADKWFVTLTAPNCSADELAGELRAYLADFVAIQRAMKRTEKIPLVCVRKLECTYNAQRDDFHPHFHAVVQGEAAARLLLKLWLKRRPEAKAIAQDVRPATDAGLRELFKYFTKLVTKTRSSGGQSVRASISVARAEKLDVIFSAMRGLRVFQPVGFTLPKAAKAVRDEEEKVGEDGNTRAPARTRDRMGEFPAHERWEWRQSLADWVSADGELLAEYEPTSGMRALVAGVDAEREAHAKCYQPADCGAAAAQGDSSAGGNGAAAAPLPGDYSSHDSPEAQADAHRRAARCGRFGVPPRAVQPCDLAVPAPSG